ncbi:MAG: hypothetical protein M1833_005533 [Piccolia ochrophora]|nr:MAG: hypothetical protein M1833_005533 [Piccolia ochrophora]
MSESPASSSETKIKLYWLEKSRAQRILWLLEELKVPYEIETFKRTKDMLAPPELKEVHPLGKSPLITINAPGLSQPMVLAESGHIVEYLTEHFGTWLAPKQWQEGKEGQIGGETEEWLRHRFYMHYTEGSLMIYLVMALVVKNIENAPVPFFIRPITNRIADKINSGFLQPNFKSSFSFLEEQIGSSPNDGEYLCGKELTGADIMMSFPLMASKGRAGLKQETHPKLWAYLKKLEGREAYKRAVDKIVELEGSYDPTN